MKEKLKGKGARIMNCEGMEFVLGDDGKVRDENGQEVKTKITDDDLGNSYLSMRNVKTNDRTLIPISDLMTYFLRSLDASGAIEDDMEFDKRDVSHMRWYTIDEDELEQGILG